MANTDTPTGLKPIRYLSGAPYNGACNPYYRASSVTTALFIGDVVVRTGSANTAVVSAPGAGEFDVGTLPTVTKTTAGDSNTDGERQTGVVVGFGAQPTNLATVYLAGSTAGVVWVADDPNLVFEVQCPSSIAATQVGLNAILLDTHSGSTVTGLSGTEIDGGDGTSPGADASYQTRIIRLINRTDNTPNSTFNKVEVTLNNHTEAQGMVTNAYGTLGI